MPGFTAESISSLPGFSSVAPDARFARGASTCPSYDACASGSRDPRGPSVRPTGAFYFPLKVVVPS